MFVCTTVSELGIMDAVILVYVKDRILSDLFQLVCVKIYPRKSFCSKQGDKIGTKPREGVDNGLFITLVHKVLY